MATRQHVSPFHLGLDLDDVDDWTGDAAPYDESLEHIFREASTADLLDAMYNGNRKEIPGFSVGGIQADVGNMNHMNPMTSSMKIPDVWGAARSFMKEAIDMVDDPRLLTLDYPTPEQGLWSSEPLLNKQHPSIGGNHAVRAFVANLYSGEERAAIKNVSILYFLHNMTRLNMGALSAALSAMGNLRTVNVYVSGNDDSVVASALRYLNRPALKGNITGAVYSGQKTDFAIANKNLATVLRHFSLAQILSNSMHLVGTYFDPALALEKSILDPGGAIQYKGCKIVNNWPSGIVRNLINGETRLDPYVESTQLHLAGYMTQVMTIRELLNAAGQGAGTGPALKMMNNFVVTAESDTLRAVRVTRAPVDVPSLDILNTFRETASLVHIKPSEINAPVTLSRAELPFQGLNAYVANKEDGEAAVVLVRDGVAAGQIGLPGSSDIKYIMSGAVGPRLGVGLVVQCEKVGGKLLPLEVTNVYYGHTAVHMTWLSRQLLCPKVLARWTPLFTVMPDGRFRSSLQTQMRAAGEGLVFCNSLMLRTAHRLTAGDGYQFVGQARTLKKVLTLDLKGPGGVTTEYDADFNPIRRRPGKKPNDLLRVTHALDAADPAELLMWTMSYGNGLGDYVELLPKPPREGFDPAVAIDLWEGVPKTKPSRFNIVDVIYHAGMAHVADLAPWELTTDSVLVGSG